MCKTNFQTVLRIYAQDRLFYLCIPARAGAYFVGETAEWNAFSVVFIKTGWRFCDINQFLKRSIDIFRGH